MYMKTSKKLLVFSYNKVGDDMKKSLPKVYANPLTCNISNNRKVYYSNDRNLDKEVEPKIDNENINMKINRLFKSSKYVYKINVEIVTKNGTNVYKIVGKNKTHLITMENELIPISTIIDIKEL